MENNISRTCQSLNTCEHEIDEVYHNYSLRCNLPDAALLILYSVWDSENGCTQADICGQWFFARQTVNTALKSLVRQGIVQLEPVEGNRKSKRIVFTDKGRRIAEKNVAPMIAAERYALEGLTDEERILLAGLTRKRTDALRREIEKLSPDPVVTNE